LIELLDLADLVGRVVYGVVRLAVEWPSRRAPPTPRRDRRGELVDALAQYPLTAIGRVTNGSFARMMGRVTRLDPLTIEDRSGVAVVELGPYAQSSLRLRLELGADVTVAGTACVDADPAWLAGGPYRGGATSTRRLVGTAQKPLLLCDALDRIARKRGR
jgi:hypothetical protein